MQTTLKPVSGKFVTRVLLLAVIILSLLAGYYQSRLYIWRTNHIRVLEKFNVNTTKELLEKDVEVK
jgi:hypothetical protein